MKVFILANGRSSRWENYLGIPKQLIEIDGEPIINRTVRLCRKYGYKDITIVGNFNVKGAKKWINSEIETRFRNIEVANRAGSPFILLYGDCYYTEAMIEDMTHRSSDTWMEYINPHENEITGKPYGEGYAHLIFDVDWYVQKHREFNQAVIDGKIDLAYGNDWMISRFMNGKEDVYTHQRDYVDPIHGIYWQDETDDFDTPEDYHRFLEHTGRKEK